MTDPSTSALNIISEQAARQLFEQEWRLTPLLTPAIGQLTLQSLQEEGVDMSSLNPWLMWFDRKKRLPLCLLQNVTEEQIRLLRRRHRVMTINHPDHGPLSLLQGRGLMIPEHHYHAEQQRQNQTTGAAPHIHTLFRRTPPRPNLHAHTLIDLKLTLNAEVQDGSGVPRYFGHIHPALAKRLGTSTLLRSDHHLHVLATCRHQDGLPLPEAADQTCTLFEQTLADSGWQMSVSPYSWDSAAYTIMLSGSRYVQSTWRWKRA